MLMKIVSGGQTGVDRAALDVALAVGLPVGSGCPKGRRAEDGRISDRYRVLNSPLFGRHSLNGSESRASQWLKSGLYCWTYSMPGPPVRV
jgi:hypothetical protein